ncbi:tRNA epoxyqueuosine(34) reductase QueG [Bacteroidota bacterium]
MTNKIEFTNQLKNEAKQLGFGACGISKASYLKKDEVHLQKWLDNDYNGSMKYMENNFEKRVDPRKLVEGAKSIISVLLNYYPSEKQRQGAPKISKYAFGKDYHIVIKNKLNQLFQFIKSSNQQINGRVFIDSAPVLEKAWAANAGLGWIGKHSILINKEYGSFVFISELIIDLELEYDKPINDYCGECTKCIDACPTNAIVAPKIIDTRKCIASKTIEDKGEIDIGLKGKFNNWIYGCDICQDVCPWNEKNVKPTKEEQFKAKTEILNYTKKDWQNLNEEKFNNIFKDSAILRTGYKSIKRNLEFITNS